MAVREVSGLPRTAAGVLHVQRYRFETGFYSAGDPMAVARGLAGALHTNPDIVWVSYGDAATGRFMGANRHRGDEFVLNVSDLRVDGGVPREYRADTGAAHVRTPPLTEPYEPRTRDWYRQAAAAAGGLVWTAPYRFAEGVRGITAAMAVKDRNGQVQGVVTVDLSLAGLDTFLGRIKIGQRGVVTLFDGSGQLLAGNAGAGRDAAARAVEGFRNGPPVAAGGVRRAEARVSDDVWDVTARSVAVGPALE